MTEDPFCDAATDTTRTAGSTQSVHDVGDCSLPFEAGMVMAIEPIIDIPDQQLHIRIEDTILVTPNGAEILSTGLPKEVNELLALIRRFASR